MPETLSPTFEVGRDDTALVDALLIIRVVMDEVVNGSPPVLSPIAQEHAIATWPEVRKRFDELLDTLRAGSNIVPAVQQKLQQVGLTGSALAMKVAGIKRGLGRMLRGTGQFFRRHLRSFFNWSNTMLGSLAEAIPGGAAEFIKEFKECLENDLEDREVAEATAAEVE